MSSTASALRRTEAHRRGWVILLSVVAAMMLAVWPLPEWAAPYRPAWVALVLVYWTMALPERIGVGWAWTAGLAVDVLTGSLLGEHALALTLTIYLTLQVSLQVRVHPMWQQTLVVGALLAVHEFIVLWMEGLTGSLPDLNTAWGPVITGALLWPWLFHILRSIRRRFEVR